MARQQLMCDMRTALRYCLWHRARCDRVAICCGEQIACRSSFYGEVAPPSPQMLDYVHVCTPGAAWSYSRAQARSCAPKGGSELQQVKLRDHCFRISAAEGPSPRPSGAKMAGWVHCVAGRVSSPPGRPAHGLALACDVNAMRCLWTASAGVA